MKPRLLPLLAALALAGCETPTVFRPAPTPGGQGYAEARIEHDRWRITFRGGSDAGPERVHDLALLRAAQVTLDQGYEWFRITGRYGEARPPAGTLSIGGGAASFGRRSAVGFGGGVGAIPLGGGSLSETLEVLMGKGERPSDPDAYDAREITRSIGP